jgi:hypothetical protein
MIMPNTPSRINPAMVVVVEMSRALLGLPKDPLF